MWGRRLQTKLVVIGDIDSKSHCIKHLATERSPLFCQAFTTITHAGDVFNLWELPHQIPRDSQPYKNFFREAKAILLCPKDVRSLATFLEQTDPLRLPIVVVSSDANVIAECGNNISHIDTRNPSRHCLDKLGETLLSAQASPTHHHRTLSR